MAKEYLARFLPGLMASTALWAATDVSSGVAKSEGTSLTMDVDGTGARTSSSKGGGLSLEVDPELADEGDGNAEDEGADPGAGGADGDPDDAGEPGGDGEDPGPLEDLGEFTDDNAGEFAERYTAEDGSLNLEVLNQEWTQNGGKALNEGTYQFLATMGFTKEFVQSIEEGQRAIIAQSDQKLYAMAGGEQQLRAAIAWGKKAMSPAQRARFNKAINSRNHDDREEAVDALLSRYTRATGKGLRRGPVRSATKESSGGPRTVGYESRDAWIADREAAKGKPVEEKRVLAKLRQSDRSRW